MADADGHHGDLDLPDRRARLVEVLDADVTGSVAHHRSHRETLPGARPARKDAGAGPARTWRGGRPWGEADQSKAGFSTS